MYLNLGAGTMPLLLPTRALGHCSYFVWTELLTLLTDWNRLALTEDSHQSGILADYLQDHRERLLEGAADPVNAAERLDQFIEYLRLRFCPPQSSALDSGT